MGKLGKDGKSLRETLEVVERMTGKTPEEAINPAELTEVAAHVWHWFLQLNASRQSGMNGANALSSIEILSFFQLEGLMPENWEIAAIRALDRVALDAISGGAK